MKREQQKEMDKDVKCSDIQKSLVQYMSQIKIKILKDIKESSTTKINKREEDIVLAVKNISWIR